MKRIVVAILTFVTSASFMMAADAEYNEKLDRFKLTLRLSGGASSTKVNADIQNGELHVSQNGRSFSHQKLKIEDIDLLLSAIVTLDLLALRERHEKKVYDGHNLELSIEYGQLKLNYTCIAIFPDQIVKFILLLDSDPVRDKVNGFRIQRPLIEETE